LDLVGDDQGEAGRAERFEVPAQNAVTGHDELVGVQPLERAPAAVVAADRDRRGEAVDLPLPVGHERGRADHQGRAPPGGHPVKVQGDDLDRLAQSHVVGQARPDPELGHPPEPGHLALLVVPQAGCQTHRWGQGCHRLAAAQLSETLDQTGQATLEHDRDVFAVDADRTGQGRTDGLRHPSALHPAP